MQDGKEISDLKVRKKNPAHVLPPDKDDYLSEERNQFYLALAAIFNDLRGIVWFYDVMKNFRHPEKGEVTSHAGDYNGLRVQLLKILISYLHEVTQFLRENCDTLNTDKFRMHFHKLSDRDQYIWNKLLALAELPSNIRLTDEGQKLVKFLIKIRNNTGYHYSQSGKNLAVGFRFHFFEIDNTSNKQNKYAYYSSSRSEFEANRYYYADAAVDGFIAKSALEVGDYSIGEIIKTVFDYSIEASRVISRLLEFYHDEKPNI